MLFAVIKCFFCYKNISLTYSIKIINSGFLIKMFYGDVMYLWGFYTISKPFVEFFICTDVV
jgi:hypothetical protein